MTGSRPTKLPIPLLEDTWTSQAKCSAWGERSLNKRHRIIDQYKADWKKNRLTRIQSFHQRHRAHRCKQLIWSEQGKLHRQIHCWIPVSVQVWWCECERVWERVYNYVCVVCECVSCILAADCTCSKALYMYTINRCVPVADSCWVWGPLWRERGSLSAGSHTYLCSCRVACIHEVVLTTPVGKKKEFTVNSTRTGLYSNVTTAWYTTSYCFKLVANDNGIRMYLCQFCWLSC